jgi:hypothetical protein
MAGKLLLYVTALMLSACASLERPSPDRVLASKLPGTYYKGDGLGEDIYLEVKADGTYSARWLGDLGDYGRASGTWRLAGNEVQLQPIAETEMLVGYLRTLVLYRGWPYYLLARSQELGAGDDSSVVAFERKSRFSR